VDRPRLFELLDRGVEGPLTLISAPAGAGKTSLLASWLAAEPREVAWLTPRPQLTEAAFWAEWLAAVQRVVPARSAVRKLAGPRTGTPAPFVVQLLNSFAELEEPLVVVVDDFHIVRSPEICAAIEQLLRAAPTSLRLVLSTRHDPPLPLHLLRASGELTELRAHDLAMTKDEVQELLDGLGVELEPHVLSLLLEQTEGWAAGIRLFTLAHRARGREATVIEAIELDERPASEYLLAEVLRRQSDEARDFLLATSVAERFTADLANAMTGRSDSAHLAERLVADNVFIERLDTQPPWYRYPPPLRRAAARRAAVHGAGTHRRAARARREVAFREPLADGRCPSRARGRRRRAAHPVPGRRLVRARRAHGRRVSHRAARPDSRSRGGCIACSLCGAREHRVHQREHA
jgi:LuxR family maltose regulon positive regulatory protein